MLFVFMRRNQTLLMFVSDSTLGCGGASDCLAICMEDILSTGGSVIDLCIRVASVKSGCLVFT